LHSGEGRWTGEWDDQGRSLHQALEKIIKRIMADFLRGLVIVIAFQLLGGWLHRVGVPIPGGVLGLLAFYLALLVGLVKLKWVERAASFLLRHMVLLFVPLTVGLMDMGHVLRRQAVAIVASLVVSFAAVLLTTGLLGRWLLPAEPVFPGQEEDAGRGEAAEVAPGEAAG
jgi:holin-like protein